MGSVPLTWAQLNGEESVDIETLGSGENYIIRAGDSIEVIARRFGVSENQLLARNRIGDKNRIFVGQELRIGSAVGEAETLVADAALTPTESAPESTVSSESPVFLVDSVGTLAADAAFADSPEPEPSFPEDENVLSSAQAEMAADPSDYFVSADGFIEVQALETLGHYADWLGIRTQRLRDINGMPFQRAVVIGQRLELDYSQVDRATFEQRRLEYQQRTQEAFFLAYQITDTREHVVRSGESLWVLALRRYRVPVWLLRQFNPDLDLDRVTPGTVVKFPELQVIASSDSESRGEF
jgi:membrane-bound lytic murein transglycosylase D